MQNFILIAPTKIDGKYVLNESYTKALKNSKIPYYISDYNLDNIKSKNINGIILTGGGDIGEKYICEKLHPKANNICIERDDFEITLVKHAFKKKIPTLGICRGAQVMNVALGGSINQHIDHHIQKEERNVPTHFVNILENTNLKRIIKNDKIKVNSIHHQVINSASKYFKINAMSEDLKIEGIEILEENIFFLGIQWHPECLLDKNSENLFKNFLKSVHNYGEN